MRRSSKPGAAILLLAALALAGAARAADYPDAAALGARVAAVAKDHPEIARAASAAQSAEGRDVWLIELGAGADEDRKTRPAMLVVAGIEGDDLAGTAAALAWIERLARDYADKPETKKLLDATTIYVFPRVNPDAAERYFMKPLAETLRSPKPYDDDRDGLVDEDGPEDLDGDGRIAWMRIERPAGEYIIDPDEPRLMKKADAAKGEKGAWRFLPEGTDNDGDELWNEDGPGGVNFNRNFPYKYDFFGADAGPHQVSEAETRALADFVVAHPNVGIAFTFGAAESLMAEPETEKPEGDGKGKAEKTTLGRVRNKKQPAGAMNEKDAPYLKELGAAWRKTLGIEKEGKNAAPAGTFSDWIYYHRGRMSLGARAWSVGLQLDEDERKAKEEKEKKEGEAEKEKEKAEEKDGEKAEGKAGKKKGKEPSEEAKFLKWAEGKSPEMAARVFVPWKGFEHPDFPGKKCEIGGFAPYAKSAPAADLFDPFATKEDDFLTTLALRLPRVAIREMAAKRLSDDSAPPGARVYEARIVVENAGYLPTVLAHGETTGEVLPTRLIVDLPDSAFLAGSRTTNLGPLAGSGGWEETRLTIHPPEGAKEIKVAVVSALGGRVEGSLKLE